MRRTIIVAFSLAACSGAAAGEPPPYPGCALDRRVSACLEDSGNSYDMLACYKPAIAELERDLDARLERFRGDNRRERSALVQAIDAAQQAWLASRDADCGAVATEWEGGSGKRGAIVACLYASTLARSRWFWRWHEDWGEGDDRCPEPDP